MNVGSGSAAQGAALPLKLPNQPGVVPVSPMLSATQQQTLAADLPFCEEWQRCREEGCALEDTPATSDTTHEG